MWLVWGLPLLAVIASLGTVMLSAAGHDGELPEQYHWEGWRVDRDFSRTERAVRLEVRAEVSGLSAGGTCQLTLRFKGDPPQELTLSVAHATLAQWDGSLHMQRTGILHSGESQYAGQCPRFPPGHWRLELASDDGQWSLRQEVFGSMERILIAPANPGLSS